MLRDLRFKHGNAGGTAQNVLPTAIIHTPAALAKGESDAPPYDYALGAGGEPCIISVRW